MRKILRIEGITHAEIREEKLLAFNNFNSLKELDLCDFIQFLCSLKGKVFGIDFDNGEMETYSEMLQYVDKLQTKHDNFILDRILKLIEESL